LKIFICEFITGGGLYREPLPPSLLKEGEMMRDAVLRDFSQIQDVEITFTYDARLARPINATQALAISPADDVWLIWQSCMKAADAVLLIAPESDGALAELTSMAERLQKMILGCRCSAVRVAADKYQTYQTLKHHHIRTIPAYLYQEWQPTQGNWVAKPIDGAGCADTAIFDDESQLDIWMQGRKDTHIIQPLQVGIAASFSMLCKDGKAYLLACNRQKITMQAGQIVYEGSVLNALAQYQEPFDLVAQSIAQAITGLSGYVGVDLVVDGDDIYVVEINPRLTTSYVAMHQACGANPARMLLDLFYNDTFTLPAIAYRKVDISLGS
jgi:predicted ATP-grasp superfamily ATP-dependent carboligase